LATNSPYKFRRVWRDTPNDTDEALNPHAKNRIFMAQLTGGKTALNAVTPNIFVRAGL